jgi:carbonic anhydrase
LQSKRLKTPLLLVLGRESCGAVKSAIAPIAGKTTLPRHPPYLVTALTPVVKAVARRPGDELENATKANVRLGSQAHRKSDLRWLLEREPGVASGHAWFRIFRRSFRRATPNCSRRAYPPSTRFMM